jgi:hypothetical protein
MIRAHYSDGYVYLSDGRLTVDDFYRSQAKAHALRELSGARHSLCTLELDFKIAEPSGPVSPETFGRPASLEDLENIRDFEGQYEARYGKFTRD